jgi:5-methylcytosine-specific restriction endonuclease McrA
MRRRRSTAEGREANKEATRRNRLSADAWGRSPAGRAALKNCAHKRRAALLANEGYEPVTADVWAAIVDHQAGRCVFCGVLPFELTQEHVVPISLKGPHCPDNLVASCHSCNSRRGNRTWSLDVCPTLAVFPLRVT